MVKPQNNEIKIGLVTSSDFRMASILASIMTFLKESHIDFVALPPYSNGVGFLGRVGREPKLTIFVNFSFGPIRSYQNEL